ncbi:hypothetical protein ACFW96_33085 [Streptomyces gardneri]|uniref:hypothetical protein n=1 Tax=Streptomyces gardneri TaxID=66892 RepID=UPI0036A9502D
MLKSRMPAFRADSAGLCLRWPLRQRGRYLDADLLERMTGALDQNVKSALRASKAGGIDRIARRHEFTNRLRRSVISQSRFHIER